MAKKKLLADKLRTPRASKKPLDLASVELVGKGSKVKDQPKEEVEEVKEQPKKKETVVQPTSTKVSSKPTPKKRGRKPKYLPNPDGEEFEMHRTSFNFPFEIYEAMRIHTFMKRTTMTDYLVELIKKDLKMK